MEMISNFLLFFSLCIQSSCLAYCYDLSICAIFRNEAPYLKEWIEFHRLVGVEHFYLCSHNSQDNYKEVLTPYIKKGIVELKELQTEIFDNVYNFNEIQCQFYNDCIREIKGISRWVAFIDTDEFLFPSTSNQLLPAMLKNYEEFGGVCVNWQLFGTSGIGKLKYKELLIEKLVCCAHREYKAEIQSNGFSLYSNILIKSIVQPIFVEKFENPHFAYYTPGYYQVNTDQIPFVGPYSPYVQVGELRINHYWSKDETYFWNHKLGRQKNWWGASLSSLLKMKEELNEYMNFSIQRYVKPLKERL
jgi:hypothetical protein